MSHGNSSKNYLRQKDVALDIAAQVSEGDKRIIGVMLESHLNEGRQDHSPGCQLEYGKSITDACLGWDDTVEMLKVLASAVRARRERKS
jgi:3-deoxy-7-phosphoheptulonate synthase